MSKVTKVEPQYPRRLDIVDMPTDAYNVTGTLRRALCKVVNYCRPYPAKTKVLRDVLVYTVHRIDGIQKLDAAEEKAAIKAVALAIKGVQEGA